MWTYVTCTLLPVQVEREHWSCASVEYTFSFRIRPEVPGFNSQVFRFLLFNSYHLYLQLHENLNVRFSPPPICSSFTTQPEAGTMNPGLVQDGTKCGNNQICRSQQCIPVSQLTTLSCPTGSNGQVCSGNGVSCAQFVQVAESKWIL